MAKKTARRKKTGSTSKPSTSAQNTRRKPKADDKSMAESIGSNAATNHTAKKLPTQNHSTPSASQATPNQSVVTAPLQGNIETIKETIIKTTAIDEQAIATQNSPVATNSSPGTAVELSTQAPTEKSAPVSSYSDEQLDYPYEAEPVPEYAPQSEPVPVHIEKSHVPNIPSMFIMHVTPELAPVAKVGGLGDVVFGLCREMEIRGNHVEIILPKYDSMRYDHIWGLCEAFHDLCVPWYGGAIHCTVFFGFVHGRKCFFIEPHSGDNFFNRGNIYGFSDDAMRFAFFSRAALEFIWKSGKHPDIIHCHDWQTGLLPVMLYEIYQHMGLTHPRVCYTVHNFKHQGVISAEVLNASGLNRPEYYLDHHRLQDSRNHQAVNLMKAGIVYSNFVTTVSPRHAAEAKDHGQGFGLESTLHTHHVKYGGIMNGLDYESWNSEIDPYIPSHYFTDNIDNKYGNKSALRQRLMLTDNEKPIVAFIGRLDPQKGLELVSHAIFYTLQQHGQFVLLGSSPDPLINRHFMELKNQLNDNPDCHLEIGYNEELSHLIYAGADMMLVPSRYEPCGLAQLIAMRYGTIPIVREVGGLADSVFDKDYSHKPLNERNGYVFRDYNNEGMESALGRAMACYYQFPEHFRDLMKNAMLYDYSWKNPGQDYLNVYDYVREK